MADLDPNHYHGVIFFVFPAVVSLSDLANDADPDQVLCHAASGWIQKCPFFVNLIK